MSDRNLNKEIRKIAGSFERQDFDAAAKLSAGPCPALKTSPCKKCKGTGGIAFYAYNGGECFSCVGGIVYRKTKASRAWDAQVMIARCEMVLAHIAKSAEELKEISAANPDADISFQLTQLRNSYRTYQRAIKDAK